MKCKTLSLLLGLAMLTALLPGCSKPTDSNKTTSANPPPPSKQDIVIGCTLQNLSEEFMTMLKAAMETKLKSYQHVTLIVNDAQGKPDIQASQIDSFIGQKVNAVIICPVDADALAPAVKLVTQAGIPCITLSADVTGNEGQVWVGSENENGGQLEAEYVAKQLNGKGNIAIMRGPLGAFAEQGRFKGYDQVLKQYPDLKVVFDQTANWQRDEAMRLMENWLTTGTKIDAVLCQNDGMALGALEAIRSSKNDNKIIVTGIDAIKDALDSIKAGNLQATCFQDAIQQGEQALDMAVRAAKGEKISRNNIPFELVTKDNVDNYYSRIKLPGAK